MTRYASASQTNGKRNFFSFSKRTIRMALSSKPNDCIQCSVNGARKTHQTTHVTNSKRNDILSREHLTKSLRKYNVRCGCSRMRGVHCTQTASKRKQTYKMEHSSHLNIGGRSNVWNASELQATTTATATTIKTNFWFRNLFSIFRCGPVWYAL